jgi:hypothetical protein
MEEVWQAARLVSTVPEFDVAYKHAVKCLEITTV